MISFLTRCALTAFLLHTWWLLSPEVSVRESDRCMYLYVPGRPSKARQGPSKGTPPRTGPRSIRGRRSMTATGGSGRAFLEPGRQLVCGGTYTFIHMHMQHATCTCMCMCMWHSKTKSRPLLFVFGYTIWGSGEDSRQIVLSERRAEWFPLTPRRFILLQVHRLNNFRGTLFCPGHRCFAPWDRGGRVCFGAAQRQSWGVRVPGR